jgi:hypothetical protein
LGKLAERLADAQRSGVYRVEVLDALEEAAAINGYPIVRVALDGASEHDLCEACAGALAAGSDDWRSLAAALAGGGWLPAPGHVLLLHGFEHLLKRAPRAFNPLLGALREAAAARKERGGRFFAAFLDPVSLLQLTPLYNWQRQSRAAPALRLHS